MGRRPSARTLVVRHHQQVIIVHRQQQVIRASSTRACCRRSSAGVISRARAIAESASDESYRVANKTLTNKVQTCARARDVHPERILPTRGGSEVYSVYIILLPEVEGSGALNCVTKRKRNVAIKNVAKKMSP